MNIWARIAEAVLPSLAAHFVGKIGYKNAYSSV
jgi:hypothetical protein